MERTGDMSTQEVIITWQRRWRGRPGLRKAWGNPETAAVRIVGSAARFQTPGTRNRQRRYCSGVTSQTSRQTLYTANNTTMPPLTARSCDPGQPVGSIPPVWFFCCFIPDSRRIC